MLDAKYKRLENYEKVAEVNRDDIHQVITYMNALHATKGGFVFPLTSKPEKSPVFRLRDSLSTLGVFGVEISKEVLLMLLLWRRCKKMNKILSLR